MSPETLLGPSDTDTRALTLGGDEKPLLACATVLKEGDFAAWDHFVSGHPHASVYHLSVWRRIFGEAFGKKWYVIGHFQDGKIVGGLPLVHMKSPLFGNFLTSMPYVNYGGILVAHKALAQPILESAVQLSRQLDVQHFELRHLENHYPGLPNRTEKVSMWLTLPRTAEELFQSFRAKLRSQVRKAEKNGLQVRNGGVELLDEFFAVFAHNMRDLGTPVYDKLFFRLILEAFPKSARLVIVRDSQSHPIAGGFLLGFLDRLEIPWASSLREFNGLQSNMFLYWHCLKYACDQGYQIFDFGRSTLGSSTFKFKEQWGAKPVGHYWHYWLSSKQVLPQLNPQNPKFRLAIALWRKLPVAVTRLIGPAIAKHLP